MAAIDSFGIDRLRTRLSKSAVILTPDTEGYQESLVRWSDTGRKEAGIVVQPVGYEDVSTVVRWATEHSIDIAVKGGGHSTAGTSSSEGGLVIDLSRMKHVSVDAAEKTIRVQGGATWKEVDEAGAAHGLATVGGTVNHTGVGGLTLGGGYGWLSGQYGLTIDNLLSAKVVLADGSQVSASPTQSQDLFWGLRGAGYNFGVVVEFKFQAYDQSPLVYSGVLAFPPEQLEKVVEVLNSGLANPDARSGAMCIITQAPDGSGPMIVVICFYNGTHEEGEARFADLLALTPILNTLGMIPYSELNTLQNPQATYGDRKSFKGVFYEPPLDTNFIRGVFDDFVAKVNSDKDLIPSAIILEFIDMRKICEVPLSQTAFASRNMTQNGILVMRWSDASKDLDHRNWAREAQKKWKTELDARKRNSLHKNDVPQYINYAEPGDSLVDNIYGANLARLQEIKAYYDPRNIFHKMHPIPLPATGTLEK
ncbi:FAD binding, berberine domain-containing protein [Penicillium ucsense]|uniref:FAD binding, berberine domain-containing protein n=1 Tax=Penicillium ucsense TaxID=2839758 RepID=A0A8J8WF82_9EURO|nr:FAD binding, berberine domain-containing protein [Penicillium ucsense]KAF7730894.1 FAD binding, berberine domain-containing protein [Penicillium ucsense]